MIEKIKDELPGAEVFLFWSRANGENRFNSDYDIWVIWWEKKIPLFKLAKIQTYIDELPIRVDLVDFNSVEERFKKSVFNKMIMTLDNYQGSVWGYNVNVWEWKGNVWELV